MTVLQMLRVFASAGAVAVFVWMLWSGRSGGSYFSGARRDAAPAKYRLQMFNWTLVFSLGGWLLWSLPI